MTIRRKEDNLNSHGQEIITLEMMEEAAKLLEYANEAMKGPIFKQVLRDTEDYRVEMLPKQIGRAYKVFKNMSFIFKKHVKFKEALSKKVAECEELTADYSQVKELHKKELTKNARLVTKTMEAREKAERYETAISRAFGQSGVEKVNYYLKR